MNNTLAKHNKGVKHEKRVQLKENLAKLRTDAMTTIFSKLQGKEGKTFRRLAYAAAIGVAAVTVDDLCQLGGIMLAISTLIPDGYKMPDSSLQRIKDWHGSFAKVLANLEYLARQLEEEGTTWGCEATMVTTVKGWYTTLLALQIQADAADANNIVRGYRKKKFKEMLMYIRTEVRAWAISATAVTKKLSLEDLNDLGFALPGQFGGHHDRKAPYDGIAEVNAKVDAMDSILITVDNAENKFGNRTKGSKPEGIRIVLYTICDENGEQFYHAVETHSQIQVKVDSKYRGQILFVRAAFLAHPNDAPNFNEPIIVSMPRDIQDSVTISKAELAAKDAELAKQAAELAELKAQMAAAKK